MGNPRNRARKRARKGKNTRKVSAANKQHLVSEKTCGATSESNDEVRPPQQDQPTPVSTQGMGGRSSPAKKLERLFEAILTEESN